LTCWGRSPHIHHAPHKHCVDKFFRDDHNTCSGLNPYHEAASDFTIDIALIRHILRAIMTSALALDVTSFVTMGGSLSSSVGDPSLRTSPSKATTLDNVKVKESASLDQLRLYFFGKRRPS
jgi:hypothetical protein